MLVVEVQLSICYRGLVWLFLVPGRVRDGGGRGRCFVGREAQTTGLGRLILLGVFVR